MFKIVHSLLRCGETRKKTLDFLEQLLAFNAKKAQLVTDRRSCSTDGLLLNLLHILQQHCAKVKLSTVEPLYLCQSDLRISIEQETRIACSQKKLEEWRKDACEPVCQTVCLFVNLGGGGMELNDSENTGHTCSWGTYMFVVGCCGVTWVPSYIDAFQPLCLLQVLYNV